jgi:hypothetical protein
MVIDEIGRVIYNVPASRTERVGITQKKSDVVKYQSR